MQFYESLSQTSQGENKNAMLAVFPATSSPIAQHSPTISTRLVSSTLLYVSSSLATSISLRFTGCSIPKLWEGLVSSTSSVGSAVGEEPVEDDAKNREDEDADAPEQLV